MRPFMSAGPSTSTKRGRTARTVASTSRAHAGLWCRTPTTWRRALIYPGSRSRAS